MKRLYPPRQRLACNIKDEKQPISTAFREGRGKAKRKKKKKKKLKTKRETAKSRLLPPPFRSALGRMGAGCHGSQRGAGPISDVVGGLGVREVLGSPAMELLDNEV